MTTKTKSCSFIDNLTRKVASETLEAFNSPTSLGLWLCLKYHDDTSACSHQIDPLDFDDSELFGRSYMAAHLLSKFKGGSKSDAAARKQRAIDKFWGCEDHLRDASSGFLSMLRRPNTLDDDVRTVFFRAREKIAQALGPIKDVFEIDSCNFGPGSSSSVTRHKAHPSKKFLACDVTSSCKPFVEFFFRDMGLVPPDDLVELESSRITVVPKTFKSDRVIAIEPDWNIFFQKGIGSAIRSQLRKAGLDLNYAPDYHSQLAREGSLTGHLATIDLSSASDSISTHLVRFLLPDDWFNVLNTFRTNQIDIDGVKTHLVKFSSMGNGFTFELESLIFYFIAKAVVEYNEASGPVSVFGDDIILETGSVHLLTRVLESAGFQINLDKSFSTGYFRESCGAHFFGGRNCKPFYLRENLVHDFEKFKFCNSIRRLAYRFHGRSYYDTPFSLPYCTGKRSIRRVYYIPEGYGDGGLASDFSEARPSAVRRKDCDVRRYSNCIEGYKVRCLQANRTTADSESTGMLMHKLRYHALLRRENFARLTSRDVGRLSRNRHLIPGEPLSHLLQFIDLIVDDPEIGNTFSVSSGLMGQQKYRIGTMHVVQWCSPEEL